MFGGGERTGCYLAECYRPAVSGSRLNEAVALLDAAALTIRADVRLLLALNAPSDEVLFGLFIAPSLDSVVQTCERAGLPADRVSGDVQVHLLAEAVVRLQPLPRTTKTVPKACHSKSAGGLHG